MRDAESSDRAAPRPGAIGMRWNPPPRSLFDRVVRRFGVFTHVSAVLLLYAIAAFAVGAALAPGQWLYVGDSLPSVDAVAAPWRYLAWGVGVGVALVIAGFGLLVAVALLNLILPTRPRPFVGGYYSSAAVPWRLHNRLFYIARYTVLPWVTLTPFGLWFLRAMGMRIGRRAVINTEFQSDPRLLRIGDD